MWAARDKKLSEMFSSPEAGGIKDVNKPTKTQVWDALTTRLFSDYQPIYRRVKNNIKRTLKANKESLGKSEYNLLKKRLWEDYDKTSDVLQTWKYRVSIHEAYIDELKNNVLDLVKSAGLNLEDLNKYMFFKHIAENRKDIFSSLGYTPKTASDGLERMRKALGDQGHLPGGVRPDHPGKWPPVFRHLRTADDLRTKEAPEPGASFSVRNILKLCPADGGYPVRAVLGFSVQTARPGREAAA